MLQLVGNRLSTTAANRATVSYGRRSFNVVHRTRKTDTGVDPIEPLLGVDQAAYLLGISSKTLRDWVQYRKIEFVKVGARVMFRPETIRSFVARNTWHPEAG